MYKVASDRRQAALHHGTLADWVNGDAPDRLEDRLAAVRRAIGSIEAELITRPPKERRAELGLRKLELQGQASELRQALGRAKVQRDGLEQYFKRAAKHILTPGQFELVLNTAKRDFDRDAAEVARVLASRPSPTEEEKGK